METIILRQKVAKLGCVKHTMFKDRLNRKADFVQLMQFLTFIFIFQTRLLKVLEEGKVLDQVENCRPPPKAMPDHRISTGSQCYSEKPHEKSLSGATTPETPLKVFKFRYI